MNDMAPILRKRPGQPPKLRPDAATLDTVKRLGSIMATTRECAAFLNVNHETFINFCKRHPIVKEILEDGKNVGKVSLRRAQFEAAIKGNVTAQIWLGKQYLEQSDKQEFTGKDGGAIEVRTLADFYRGQIIDYLPPRQIAPPSGGGDDEPEGDDRE